ncbi:SusC/RagA family TonB-linked outer membrane protein [Flavivirga eckloniae]|uniref:SusC/RagA family TonB-linked outer membrane protein n=1 Tax=Flavivirga eckloniae TaxID=1803846 RepID=A0A2K9PRM2_9FLAO|nr:TonB-dependent receptor [Flavivirga eckloniae]AUP79720.1 SusC/RagA family TonB-linked outer membrane protein [Flavivirga eckloniae]
MKLNYTLVIGLLSFCLSGWAQQKTVTGIVTDEQGVPLPGTNILEAGTSNGVQADFDGNYSITVNDDATLVFSFVGMLTQRIPLNGRTKIDVTLIEDAARLNEVVVVGYGTQRKVNLTGSVETINASEIARQPVLQTSQALAGLVPGLSATQSSGQPGGDGATIRIRGLGTIGSGANNNPLILVDGIPDDINGIDPSDIKSISVLKDASAAAIYGSRASNGVILITTNRGKEGILKTTYNTYFGVQGQTQNFEFANALEYMQAFNDADPGAFPDSVLDQYRAGVGLGTEALPDTDWLDLLFSEPGFQHYHNLSVRGGSEKAKIAASVSYMNQEGNIPNFDFERVSGRFNTDLKLGNKIDISFDLNFRREVNNQPANLQNVTRQANRLQPLFIAINDDGSWGEGFSGGNSIALVNSGSQDERITNYFRGVIKATYRPIEDLSISATYSPQYTSINRDDFNRPWVWKSSSTAEPVQLGLSSVAKETQERFADNFNIVINYSKDFGDHSLSGLVGYEFLKTQSETWGASRGGFILPDFRTLDNGDADTSQNYGRATLSGLESVFGRVNYSYKGKYLFEANVRRDASSRFSDGFRAATFPSLSVGWRISDEDFFPEDSFVSSLKLRTSWGQLGNQFIFENRQFNGATILDYFGNPLAFPRNFIYQSQFGVGNANPVLGGVPTVGGAQPNLANSELQWERSETYNIGVDASLFSKRLTFTGEYYVRTTKDILLGVTLQPSTGFASVPPQNAGEVQNKGWDFSIGWQDSIGDHFTYGFNANYSVVDNKVTDLGGLNELPPGDRIIRVGESINSIFGFKEDGLYQESDFTGGDLNSGLPVPAFGAIQPGDIKYVDLNNDGIINNDDRTVIGSDIDTNNWGFDVFANYKGFDLFVSVLGVSGRDVYLSQDAGWSFFNAGKIQKWQLDYWTPTNTDASLPRPTALSAHHNWRVNETWTHDASYVRVRNITLGYKLPQDLIKKLNVNNIRIYISGQNLFTFDKMPDGIDPLIPNFNTGDFYPVSKVYTAGLNIGF